MGIFLAGIVTGGILLYVLVSLPVLAAVAFIAYVLRQRQIDAQLKEPLPSQQTQVLYTAAQLQAVRQMLAGTGYAYDWQQNIFYSLLYPWQRDFGYCSLYDESSVPFGMVIDCEPVTFEYGGKRWLIELWKGQYGITTGGEIGIYNTTGPDLDIPGVFNGTFYHCVKDEDTLSMTYALLRNNEVLFQRAGRHWWLTGFRLGEFTKPAALTMEASITFRDQAMLQAFLGGLKKNGYKDKEFRINGNTILILFAKPHAKQPLTRRGFLAWLTLRRNRRLVATYRRLTKDMGNNLYDILTTLKEKSPVLYGLTLNAGRQEEFFKFHEKLLEYID
ncbi:DUF4474 domain-containing protein [Oscillospiraceae bacterium WX1]